jgi:hypothetical protein
MAHGTLCDAQLLGGAGEADVSGSGFEGLKRIELWQAPGHGSSFMRKTQRE